MRLFTAKRVQAYDFVCREDLEPVGVLVLLNETDNGQALTISRRYWVFGTEKLDDRPMLSL